MVLWRLFNPNVRLTHRAVQLANTALTPLLARPFRLTHVVEFPKCGGSWVRNMIRTYLGSDAYLGNRLIFPDAVIHTHRLYRRSYRKPIIVVRDPRDVYVSFYYHETRYEEREKHQSISRYFQSDPRRPLREDFAAYLEAKLTKPSHPWFTYSEFVDSWLGRPGIFVVRYVDFLEDAESTLTQLLRFLGRPIDPGRLRHAIEVNRFERQTQERYGQARTPGEADDSKFLRKGIAGDWQNHFNRASCELLERFDGRILRRLGYEKDRSWIDRFLDEQRQAG
jgi:hypothetical protein